MPPFSEEQIIEAKRWWLTRFIQNPAGRSFALREHDLEQGAKIKSHVRDRNARFDVTFIVDEHRNFILVSPRTDEAHWCYGVIRLTPRGYFYYRSLDYLEQLKLLAEENDV